jgi:NAD(P)-dependent dehydrogenase (short-subunit alcohol dehydrogenase family)
MRTVMVTGGTDGMGAALTRQVLAAGDRVIVVGRSHAKFERLAAGIGADDRLRFVAADLSSIAESRRLVAEVAARYDRLDALVLAASYIRQRRHVTAEGHEASWVLFFVSKYLLTSGLAGQLAAAPRPIIVNVAVPGAKSGAIDFDDLESERGFTFGRSNAQQRRANELLGLVFGADPRCSYVTWGPRGPVRTGFAGEFGPAMRLGAKVFGLIGAAPEKAVAPMMALLGDPPTGRHAYRGSKPVPLVRGADDAGDLARLLAAVSESLTR